MSNTHMCTQTHVYTIVFGVPCVHKLLFWIYTIKVCVDMRLHTTHMCVLCTHVLCIVFLWKFFPFRFSTKFSLKWKLFMKLCIKNRKKFPPAAQKVLKNHYISHTKHMKNVGHTHVYTNTCVHNCVWCALCTQSFIV